MKVFPKKIVSLVIMCVLVGIALFGCGKVAQSTSSSGGGGGSNPPPSAGNIAVQLTKVSAPTTAYTIENLTVTVRKVGDSAVYTGTTDVTGVAKIDVPASGIYEVISVNITDTVGTAKNAYWREFIKPSPISSTAISLNYSPAIPPTGNITLGNLTTINMPIAIRKTTIIEKITVAVGGNDNPYYYVSGNAAFAGRLILSDIQSDTIGWDSFSVMNSEYFPYSALTSWFVFDFDHNVSNMPSKLYSATAPLEQSLGDIPDVISIELEVPTSNDWAINSGANSYNKAGTNFGLFPSDPDPILQIYNKSVPHIPSGNITVNYEVQRFEDL